MAEAKLTLKSAAPSDLPSERGCIATLLICDGQPRSTQFADMVVNKLEPDHFWNWPLDKLFVALTSRRVDRWRPLWFVGLLKREGVWQEMQQPALTVAEVIDSLGWIGDVPLFVRRLEACRQARQHFFDSWESLCKAKSAVRDTKIWPCGIMEV